MTPERLPLDGQDVPTSTDNMEVPVMPQEGPPLDGEDVSVSTGSGEVLVMAQKGSSLDGQGVPASADIGEEEEVTINESDNEDDNEGVPLDTGWAWVIAFSAQMILTISFGYDRVLSVLFIDISQEFGASATVVSLIFTIMSVSGSIAVLFITNVIMPRFSIRTMCAVAGVCSALTTLIISQAPNIIVVLLFCIVKGAMFQVLLIGPMSIIGYYFKERRSLATSVANLGMCISCIGFPPITELLRLEYGMRGSLLVISAIELHVVLFSLLLRPVESYKKIHANKMTKQQAINSMTRKYDTPIVKCKIDSLPIALQNTTLSDEVGHVIEEVIRERDTLLSKIVLLEKVIHSDHMNDKPESDANGTIVEIEIIHPKNGENGSPPSSSHPLVSSSKEFDSVNPMARAGVDSANPVARARVDSIGNQWCSSQGSKKTTILERKTSQMSAISTSDLSFVPPGWTIDNNADNDEGNNEGKTCMCKITDVIDLSLFKILRFRMMLAFMALGVYSVFLSVYMPAIAYSSGISKSDSALLLMMSGIIDLVTRCVTGYIGDFPWFSKSKVVAFCTLILAVIAQVARFITSYSHFVAFSLAVGCFGGVRQNFFAIMLMEYVGVEKFPKALGLGSICATVSLSFTFPIIGALVDATGGFIIPLHFIGAIIFLAVIVLATEPFLKKLDEKRLATEKDELESRKEMKHLIEKNLQSRKEVKQFDREELAIKK